MKFKNRKQLICNTISAGMDALCDTVNGLEIRVILGNHADLANGSYTENATTKAIESISLDGSTVAYAYNGILSSNNAKNTMIEGKYRNGVDHLLEMVLFDVTAAGKLKIEALMNSSVFAIVQYKYKGTAGNCKYELFGLQQGLRMSALERDHANAENLGGFAVALKTPTGYPESRLARTIWVTDEAATDTVVDGTLV